MTARSQPEAGPAMAAIRSGRLRAAKSSIPARKTANVRAVATKARPWASCRVKAATRGKITTSADPKKTEFFRYSQMGGTLPAPLFIFLAGVSVALVTEKLRGKGVARDAIAKQVMWRGAEVFGLGILFRVQEFILGIPISPWTDLLRVDVLNILGLSMILLGVLCWVAGGGDAVVAAKVRTRNLVLALAAAAVVSIVTPALWTTWRPRFLPWQVESYVNGVHIFDKPQVWLFPIFPWAAFAFVGLAVGFWLFSGFSERWGGLGFFVLGLAGGGGFWLVFG